jgi:hypothetical protein
MRRGTHYRPIEHAASLGLEVTHGRLRDGRKGEYRHRDRLIVLRRGLSERQERCTLTHEVMHALAGDVRSCFGPVTARQELRADRAAAWWLICPEEYRIAEALHGAHPGAIADELDVTLHRLEVWRRSYVSAFPRAVSA